MLRFVAILSTVFAATTLTAQAGSASFDLPRLTFPADTSADTTRACNPVTTACTATDKR